MRDGVFYIYGIGRQPVTEMKRMRNRGAQGLKSDEMKQTLKPATEKKRMRNRGE